MVEERLFQRLGGFSALTAMATYLVGFALLASQLAAFGYGTTAIDAEAFLSFASRHSNLMTGWNTIIYIVNGFALIGLSIALSRQTVSAMAVQNIFILSVGITWATLVIGAGMIANIALEQTLPMLSDDPDAAATLWRTLHAVELGLGGGNELVGAVWLLLVCVGRFRVTILPYSICMLGLIPGVAGLLTVIGPIGDICGAIFGLGLILWFGCVGVSLLRSLQGNGLEVRPSTV